jgi:hypothetical protein
MLNEAFLYEIRYLHRQPWSQLFWGGGKGQQKLDEIGIGAARKSMLLFHTPTVVIISTASHGPSYGTHITETCVFLDRCQFLQVITSL